MLHPWFESCIVCRKPATVVYVYVSSIEWRQQQSVTVEPYTGLQQYITAGPVKIEGKAEFIPTCSEHSEGYMDNYVLKVPLTPEIKKKLEKKIIDRDYRDPERSIEI